MAWGDGTSPEHRRLRASVLAEEPVCRCKGCVACSKQGCSAASTDMDHITPLSLGGGNTRANVRGLCPNCHAVKSNLEALAARWRVRERRPSEPHPGLRQR